MYVSVPALGKMMLICFFVESLVSVRVIDRGSDASPRIAEQTNFHSKGYHSLL
jgi:hypothetical protein